MPATRNKARKRLLKVALYIENVDVIVNTEILQRYCDDSCISLRGFGRVQAQFTQNSREQKTPHSKDAVV